METNPLSFAAPVWFWAMAVVPVYFWLCFAADRRREAELARLVSPRLREQLVRTVNHAARWWKRVFYALAIVFLSVALARPQMGFDWQETTSQGRNVILAVDVSKSMLADDLSPNRMVRARLAAHDLVTKLDGDRIGLVAFAGSAFLQAPLTVDQGAVINAIQELEPGLIPRGGTNIAQAIKVAIDAFGKGEGAEKAMVIFSDGEELSADGVAMARDAAKQGIRIFTVGVGSPSGSVIPLIDETGHNDFVRDNAGSIVTSKLDESRLREIAQATGGFYVSLGEEGLERVVNDGLLKMNESELESKVSRTPIERFQWPLGAAVLLLLLNQLIPERRWKKSLKKAAPVTGTPSTGKAVAVAVLILAATQLALLNAQVVTSQNPRPSPQSAEVPATSDLPADPQSLYASGRYDEAYQQFQQQLSKKPESPLHHFNAGAAAYKSGKFEDAITNFSDALLTTDKKLRRQSHYNLANALYRKGEAIEDREKKIKDWKGAIQHYDSALQLDPKDADAKFNRDLVQRKLEEAEKQQEQEKQEQQKQEQEEKKDEQKPEDQEKKDQSGDKDDQKGDSGEKPEDSKKESEQKDQQNPDSGKSEGEGKDDKSEKGESKEEKDETQKPESGDSEQKDQGGEDKKEGEQKPEDGESEKKEPSNQGNEPKNAQGEKSEGGENQQSPAPVPEQEGERPKGDIQGTQDSEPTKPGEEQAQPMAMDGGTEEMNAAEARALFQALGGEEVRVDLNDTKPPKGFIDKDW